MDDPFGVNTEMACKSHSLHLSFRPVGPGICLLSLAGVVYRTGMHISISFRPDHVPVGHAHNHTPCPAAPARRLRCWRQQAAHMFRPTLRN